MEEFVVPPALTPEETLPTVLSLGGRYGIFIGIRVFPGKLEAFVDEMEPGNDVLEDEVLTIVEESRSIPVEEVAEMRSTPEQPPPAPPKAAVRVLDIFMNLPSGGP